MLFYIKQNNHKKVKLLKQKPIKKLEYKLFNYNAKRIKQFFEL